VRAGRVFDKGSALEAAQAARRSVMMHSVLSVGPLRHGLSWHAHDEAWLL
jgi:hypothetical protein